MNIFVIVKKIQTCNIVQQGKPSSTIMSFYIIPTPILRDFVSCVRVVSQVILYAKKDL